MEIHILIPCYQFLALSNSFSHFHSCIFSHLNDYRFQTQIQTFCLVYQCANAYIVHSGFCICFNIVKVYTPTCFCFKIFFDQ